MIIAIILGIVLLALVGLWVSRVRGGPVTEKPDETIRKAQRREL